MEEDDDGKAKLIPEDLLEEKEDVAEEDRVDTASNKSGRDGSQTDENENKDAQ